MYKKVIKDAINAEGPFRVLKVWAVELDEPHFLTGEQVMRVEISVVRRRKRKARKGWLGNKLIF